VNLVPYYNQWSGSETKLDLKAVYRRPEPDGSVTLAPQLPLRRHTDWTAKGFEYVTLSTLEELGQVAPFLRQQNLDPLTMRDCYDHKGNFKVDEYMRDQKQSGEEYLADLQAKVDKYGAETVTDMMRVHQPAFTLPASIKIPVKAEKARKDVA
jgi:hypothetical protein